MDQHEVELAIGDTFQVGHHTFTVIDIDGDDVSFRVERCSGTLDSAALACSDTAAPAFSTRPR